MRDRGGASCCTCPGIPPADGVGRGEDFAGPHGRPAAGAEGEVGVPRFGGGGRASWTSGSRGKRLRCTPRRRPSMASPARGPVGGTSSCRRSGSPKRGSSPGVDEGARQRRRTVRAQDAGQHCSRGVPLVVSYGLGRRGAGPDIRPSQPEGPAGRGGRHNPLNLRGRRHVTADPALPRTESLAGQRGGSRPAALGWNRPAVRRHRRARRGLRMGPSLAERLGHRRSRYFTGPGRAISAEPFDVLGRLED